MPIKVININFDFNGDKLPGLRQAGSGNKEFTFYEPNVYCNAPCQYNTCIFKVCQELEVLNFAYAVVVDPFASRMVCSVSFL